ncbi:hypothetical protein EX349_20580 [Pseudomonas protegens]|uniref:hypothetical protein n=1 Tax=Pseudomonas protegens TaxID=380021 RepID=UPI001372EA49|nr:hypothetical protein [Pseudomonas protegens]NAN53599.1 hypothetical protein [Pseudomonas protegens]NUE78064.1 hypothetical protein [Pseudomonas protegens]
MKRKAAALAISLVIGSSVYAQEYTNSFIANIFAEKDQERGAAATQERKEQLLEMTKRAVQQCRNNLPKGKEAENIGNMIVMTRKKLDEANVPITHYELLDVVYSALSDGKKNWDCASVLAMYMTLRIPSSGESGLTHIGAYKTIQSGRDSGLLGPS